MSNKSKGQLIVITFTVLYWIILPTVLYVTMGILVVAAFMLVNVVAMEGAVRLAGRR
jgi:hypothetical protein